MIYAGIGSRETPPAILEKMTRIAQRMSIIDGYTLRSGGAVGADSAFEEGATKMEIFIPWAGYNGIWPDDNHILVTDGAILYQAEKIMAGIHPKFHNLSIGARRLHTRNVFQILGADLKTPVNFVAYWCKRDAKGNPTGGTATAVNLARKLGIREYFVDDM